MSRRSSLPVNAASALAFARRPELLAFLPALTLAAFWIGGEQALVFTALLVPLTYAIAAIAFPLHAQGLHDTGRRDPSTGLTATDAALALLDEWCIKAESGGKATACILLDLDDAERLSRRHGHAGFAEIMRLTAARLSGSLREGDIAAQLNGSTFAVILAPVIRLDLESVLQVAARLQDAAEAPISLESTTVRASCSIGFCQSLRSPGSGGAALLEAAQAALDDARHNGPSAIRAHTAEMQKARADRNALRQRIAPALNDGEVVAWFQPQVSTDTGEISGFETLARWHHPSRGVLMPSEFLPDLLAAGLSERLGEVMLGGALRALRRWEDAGHRIGGVAVNFAAEELRNPRLPDKVQWELDRYAIAPQRLTVEILETVIAEAADDMVVQTIGRLAKLGCRIDLDDFGTGHASMSAIRRFAVSRIKIDRSFITRLDEDREQQRMVSAILSMAERLGLETVAEGVETTAEHALLAQLGCTHVQGYGIARPMPCDAATDWIADHHTTRPAHLPLGRSTG